MLNKPIFFERNRVGRVYSGGKLFHGFFGDEPEDGFLPEEWIASSVRAINKEMAHNKEGVSKIKDSDMFFDELLAQFPEEMLGPAREMRILVKILDSAVRLPAQAHPDKAFSKKYFHSEYGKTESWIILDTRPGAKIYFGFKEGIDKKAFSKAVDASADDKYAMEQLMEYSEPQVGDVFLVPAKMIHAIGSGCLILEVQEPTDFTIQPEHWCGDYALSDKEMYIGLSKETALECFDFRRAPDAKILPETAFCENGVKIEKVIQASHTDCFCINRVTIKNGEYRMNIKDSYGVYIVTDGSGKMIGKEYAHDVRKGDYFFMPACLMNQFSMTGDLTVIECW